jgi:hypothetical protein
MIPVKTHKQNKKLNKKVEIKCAQMKIYKEQIETTNMPVILMLILPLILLTSLTKIRVN